MVGALVFLTPSAALVTLVVVVPLAALAVTLRREQLARRVLRLDDPPGGGQARTALGIVAAVALLGLAAAQPAIRTSTGQQVRTDAEAIYVVDTSRSMLASRTSRSRTRLQRARADAMQIRRELADIPSGVATLTDRVLPDLLPNASVGVFERTVGEVVRVDNPPPQSAAATASSLGALATLGTKNFFSPSARHRLIVVLTDGETRPYDVQATAGALGHGPGVKTIFVHVSSPGEAVYGASGAEPGYHEDPTSGAALGTLAEATGGSVVGADSTGEAARLARSAIGEGPTRREGLTVRTRTLAPWLALISLVPLAIAFGFGAAQLRRVARRSTADDRSPYAKELAVGEPG